MRANKKTVPLTVIVDRTNPVSTAYLCALEKAGYKVEKLLLVNFVKPGSRFKALSRILGTTLTLTILSGYKILMRLRNRRLKQIFHALQAGEDVKLPYLGLFRYRSFADKIETMPGYFENYRDKRLEQWMRGQKNRFFLFTGGGIVPSNIFDIEGLKLLHVHPGIVPDIKGSDCFLWSLKIRDKIGMSAFFMNSGIDCGDIITQKEYDVPSLIKPLQKGDEELICAAIKETLDPIYRAKTLINLLDALPLHNNVIDLSAIQSKRQHPHEGRDYYAMHPSLRARVIADYFLKSKARGA